MMRFNWLHRGHTQDVATVEELVKELETYGYYSVLLTYHSKADDYFIKAARVLTNKQKIKLMLAIRTYAISPEYLSMICKSLNHISKEKITLNVCSGDFDNGEPDVLDNLVDSGPFLTAPKRAEYTDKWMEKFLKLKDFNVPDIYMAGHSEYTKNMAVHYNATHISMYDMYLKDLKKQDRIINKKQLITIVAVVRETQEEANLFFNEHVSKGSPQIYTFCGTKEYVKAKIKDIESMGGTEILLSRHINDNQVQLVHETIKELACE